MRKNLFDISPETRLLFQEVWHNPTLLKRWASDQRLQRVSADIIASGKPGATSHLLQLGLSEDASVRMAARAAVDYLVSLVPAEGLPELDEAARKEWEYLDLWHGLRPEAAAQTQLDSEEDAVFLRLATCHRSGYVRERAVRLLARDPSPKAVPFLILRTVDWVPEVRAAAQFELGARLKLQYADAFVLSLLLVERLRASTRFAPEQWDAIKRFLCKPDCQPALQEGLKSDSRKIRRSSFVLAVDNPGFSTPDLIDEAVSDPDVLVRHWAFTFAHNKMPEYWPKLRQRASVDSFSGIRRMALESFEAEPSLEAEQLLHFLLDSSPGIRHSAQSLAKDSGISAADCYRATLEGNGHFKSVCALGLAETGDPSDAPRIASLMSDESARTRRAVIRALRALGINNRQQLLMNALSLDVPSVAREAAISLLDGHLASPEVVWKEALKNENALVWRAVLKLLRHVGKWTQITVYLEAVEVTVEAVSSFAIERLRSWLTQYNNSFALPDGSDRMRIPVLLQLVSKKLPASLNRELHFVIETALNGTR